MICLVCRLAEQYRPARVKVRLEGLTHRMKIAHRAASLKIAHRAATPDFDGGAISEAMVAVCHFRKQVAVFCFLACAAPHALFLVVQQLPTHFLCCHRSAVLYKPRGCQTLLHSFPTQRLIRKTFNESSEKANF